jgi:hypothetical protein
MSDDLSFGPQLSTRQIEALINDGYGGGGDFRMGDNARFSISTYEPPGPRGAEYIRSQGPIDVIMGPGGSGKTVASCMKGVRFSLAQMPICTDGTIRVKGTVVRDNYRSLYRSTLQTWFDWFPTTLHPDFSGGQDRPGCHRLKLRTVRLVDGIRREVKLDLQVDFFAIADVNYEALFKSYETSWAWATEADTLPPASIPFFFSRTARFPSLRALPEGAIRPRVMMVDMNPPPPDHPLLVAADRGSFNENFDPTKDERTVNFFRQPSGLSDQAENRKGKSRADYELEMRTMPRDDARRMVEGKPGRVKDGLPVYDEDFDDQFHVAPQMLDLMPGVPINLGFDQGGQSGGAGQPAMAGFQVAANGQIRFVAEVVTDPGTGAERFLDQLIPVLGVDLHGLPPGVFTGDPAGFLGGDKIYGTEAWFEIISKAIGRRIDPAPTQEWTPRLEALGVPMRRHISAKIPRLVVCPVRCPGLVKALNGGFKFGKRHDGTFDPRPVKNKWANIAEAAQYGVLGVFGLTGLLNTIASGSRGSNVVALGRHEAQPAASHWNPLDI